MGPDNKEIIEPKHARRVDLTPFYAERADILINSLPIGLEGERNDLHAEELLNIATSTGNGLSPFKRLSLALHVEQSYGEAAPQSDRARRVQFEILGLMDPKDLHPYYAKRLESLRDVAGPILASGQTSGPDSPAG